MKALELCEAKLAKAQREAAAALVKQESLLSDVAALQEENKDLAGTQEDAQRQLDAMRNIARSKEAEAATQLREARTAMREQLDTASAELSAKVLAAEKKCQDVHECSYIHCKDPQKCPGAYSH